MSTSSLSAESTWWRRPAGGREVLQVALPLVVSTISWTVMTFVDRMFLNWSSSVSMAASFSASVVWFATLCLPLGICSYVNTFVSQYFGDGQPRQIGPSVGQGVWVAVISIPFVLLPIPLASRFFEWAAHGPEAIEQETLYFQIICLGGPGMLLAQAFSAFYSGRGKTWVVMIVDSSVVGVNLLLDYLWIFGKAGFPAMGIAGAAWATTVSLWLKVVIYLVMILRHQHRVRFNTLAGLKLDKKLFGRLMYYGFPSGMQMVLDVLGWSVFVMLVGRMGGTEYTATTLAFSVSSLAFMPIWGFGMATGILVGQYLGEDRDDLAARATWNLLSISLAYMATISVFYVLTPGLFLTGFFAGSEAVAAEKAAAYQMAVYLLRIVACYNLLDAVLMIFVNALKGAGDTRYIMAVSVVMGAFLASFSWLAVERWHLSIYGCWSVAVCWVWGMGLAFFLRFQTGKWRLMRVIDSQHPVTLHEDSTLVQAASTSAITK